jgi:hypothetical protein
MGGYFINYFNRIRPAMAGLHQAEATIAPRRKNVGQFYVLQMTAAEWFLCRQ